MKKERGVRGKRLENKCWSLHPNDTSKHCLCERRKATAAALAWREKPGSGCGFSVTPPLLGRLQTPRTACCQEKIKTKYIVLCQFEGSVRGITTMLSGFLQYARYCRHRQSVRNSPRKPCNRSFRSSLHIRSTAGGWEHIFSQIAISSR